MTETPAFVYQVVVKGVYGRNRKAKLGIFKLAQTSEPMSHDVVKAKAMEAIRAEKVKPGAFVSVEEQPGTVSDYGDGLTSFSFMLFSETKIVAGWLTPEGTLGPK